METYRSNLKCFSCGKIFSDRSNLIRHEKEKHRGGADMVECTRCCPPKKILKRSFKSHFRRRHEEKTLKCSECSKMFAHNQQLKTHILSYHVGEQKCGKCNDVLSSKHALFRHMKRHK